MFIRFLIQLLSLSRSLSTYKQFSAVQIVGNEPLLGYHLIQKGHCHVKPSKRAELESENLQKKTEPIFKIEAFLLEPKSP